MGATVKRGAVQIPLLVGDKTGVWCASIRLIETEKHFLACFCPSEGGTDPSKHHDRNPLNFHLISLKNERISRAVHRATRGTFDSLLSGKGIKIGQLRPKKYSAIRFFWEVRWSNRSKVNSRRPFCQ